MMNPRRSLALAIVLGGLALSQSGHAQPAQKIVPKLEPVAETKLLMEGLAHANFKGVERALGQKPAEVQTWTFARGQALLVAETANLLMLRPPQKEGQAEWFEQAMTLRARAAELAQTLGKKDFDGSRAALSQVAESCNRCHLTFRVPVQIEPFAEDK